MKTAWWLSTGIWPGRQDGNNLVTNKVTLAEFDDRFAAGGTAALSLSAVWACVNLIAGTGATLPLMVYRMRGDRRETATDHPLYRVLHDSPNAEQTAVDFWEGAFASLELKGNAVAEIDRAGDGRVLALTPLAWDDLNVSRREGGPLEYRRKGELIDAGRILHIRGFGGAPEGGLSTLTHGRRVFGLALAVDRAADATFANGARPSGVLKFKEWLKPEQRQLAESRMTEKFVGSVNAGRPMVLEGGVDWQQLTINPEDAQMLESRAFSIEEVARLFGVPPHMIGHTEKSTSWGTGIEQQTIGFVQYTMRRRLKRIEQALEKYLLTPRDRAEGISIEFNVEGLLRGDSKTRADFHASGLQNGWLTINEVRRRENLPPVEGGDVPRMQMQNVPITEAGQMPAGGPQ
jgi:HK97 family phage portal protein